MADYWEADEPRRLGEMLVDAHHPHLDTARIEYVFRDEASVTGNKVVLAKARKVTGLNAFLARSDDPAIGGGDFFCIEVAADTWEALNEAQRRALIDHELMHCAIGKKGKLELRPHDVEEFATIVERHGFWKWDLREFMERVKGIQTLGLVSGDGAAEDRVDTLGDKLAAAGVTSVTISRPFRPSAGDA
jgi:predicted metallopeptidase